MQKRQALHGEATCRSGYWGLTTMLYERAADLGGERDEEVEGGGRRWKEVGDADGLNRRVSALPDRQINA